MKPQLNKIWYCLDNRNFLVGRLPEGMTAKEAASAARDIRFPREGFPESTWGQMEYFFRVGYMVRDAFPDCFHVLESQEYRDHQRFMHLNVFTSEVSDDDRVLYEHDRVALLIHPADMYLHFGVPREVQVRFKDILSRWHVFRRMTPNSVQLFAALEPINYWLNLMRSGLSPDIASVEEALDRFNLSGNLRPFVRHMIMDVRGVEMRVHRIAKEKSNA